MSRGAKRWYATGWAVAALIMFVVGGTGMLTVKALGLRTVVVDAEPFELPPSGFDYGRWSSALERWAGPGGVDYEAVLAEEDELGRFVATLGAVGPQADPERFTTEPERLSYYLNVGKTPHFPRIYWGKLRQQTS